MKSKNSIPDKPSAMRSCGTRLPFGLYHFLLQEAEMHGTTIGDMIRKSCDLYRNNLSLEETLNQLEKRLFRKIFESHCVVVGLSSEERDEALTELKSRLRGRSQ